MADKGGLQLLPETRKRIDVNVPGENRTVYIGVALIVLVLAVYGGLWWYSQNLNTKIAEADNQLLALEKGRDKKAEQSLITLSKQIGITNQLIKSHTYWSAGFSRIESALQTNVQFRSFSAVLGEEAIHMRALSNNYVTLAKQLAAFVSDNSVRDITLDGVSTLTNGKLDFSAKILFDKSKFLKNQ